jgi:hypothetical protein
LLPVTGWNDVQHRDSAKEGAAATANVGHPNIGFERSRLFPLTTLLTSFFIERGHL